MRTRLANNSHTNKARSDGMYMQIDQIQKDNINVTGMTGVIRNICFNSDK